MDEVKTSVMRILSINDDVTQREEQYTVEMDNCVEHTSTYAIETNNELLKVDTPISPESGIQIDEDIVHTFMSKQQMWNTFIQEVKDA